MQLNRFPLVLDFKQQEMRLRGKREKIKENFIGRDFPKKEERRFRNY